MLALPRSIDPLDWLRTRNLRSLALSLATYATLAAACIAASWSAIGRPGWPYNHEYLSFVERTEWFRRAFLAGDLFPIWTPFCFNGHGSPGPLLYHRLFTTLSAGLAASLGTSAATGDRIAVVLLQFLGAVGMERAGAALGWSRPLRLSGALLLLTSRYVLTDWIVRGAMAEFSAAMVLPHVLAACVRWIRGERAAKRLALALVLLFYAHTTIFLFSWPLGVLALALAGRTVHRLDLPEKWRPWIRDLAAAALIVTIGIGPYAASVLLLGRHFNLAALHQYLPWEQYVRWPRYFVDRRFGWGHQWQDFSVEIGRDLWLALALGAAAALALRRRFGASALGFLVGASALYGLMLLPVSAPFYRHMPGGSFLQFPWRLLVFLTPLLILIVGELANGIAKALPGRLPAAALAVGYAVMVGYQTRFCLRAQNTSVERFPESALEEISQSLDGPVSGGEFLPKGLSLERIPPAEPFLEARACQVLHAEPESALRGAIHFRDIVLDVNATANCRVRFSQFRTPFVAVRMDGIENGGDGASERRTFEVAVPPGLHRIVFHRRSLLEAVRAGWSPAGDD